MSILYLLIILMILILAIRGAFFFHMSRRFCSLEQVKPAPAAIVFGAGLVRGGYPSTVLKERIETAAALWQTGKVEYFLFSGNNRDLYYNEPFAMRAYAESLGVPTDRILLDPDGNRTYESCLHANNLFHIRDAILITQTFHMPRCMLLAERCGIQIQALPSSHRSHDWYDVLFWNFRETFATLRAFYDVRHFPDS